MPLVHGIQMVSLDSIRDEKARDYDVWIVAVEKELMPILRIPMEEDVQTIPEEICFVTVLDAGERGQLSVDRYREIVKQAKLQGYKPNGDILSCLLARCWDNGAYHRYFEVFIPPEKSTKRHFCTTRLPVQTKNGPALYKAAPSKIRQYIAKPPSLFISEGGFMWSG